MPTNGQIKCHKIKKRDINCFFIFLGFLHDNLQRVITATGNKKVVQVSL